MSNTRITVKSLAEQVAALTEVVSTLTTIVVAANPQEPAKAAPVEQVKVEQPKPAKPAKPMTLTTARAKALREAGIVPRGTTKAQMLAGVDCHGKPLSDEAKEILSGMVAPTGAMRKHLHDLKEHTATPVVEAPAPAAPEQLDIVAMLIAGGFTPEQAQEIVSK